MWIKIYIWTFKMGRLEGSSKYELLIRKIRSEIDEILTINTHKEQGG